MNEAKPFCISKWEVWEAYKRVKANKGAAGVDEQSIEDFEKRLKKNLYKIWNRMSSGSYLPPPVRTVKIPKANGGERKLGIPTVSDRIAQQVVKSRLEPEVDVATVHWYDTRHFVLVDKPVSLRPGHIKTGEFTASLKGTYGIAFDTDVPYIYGCPQYLVLKTHWVVTRDGRVTAHREPGGYEWEEPGAPIEDPDLGSFDAEPGTYNLDVEQLSDGRCLDVGKPRLRVYLSGWDRTEYDDLNAKLQLFSFLSIARGLAFLFAHRFAMLREGPRPLLIAPSLSEQKPTWGITGLRYRRFPVRRGWAVNPLMNLPTIALVGSLTWLTWLVPIWVVGSVNLIWPLLIF